MTRDYSFFYQGDNQRGVLLLHGLTGTPSELHAIGKALHRRGFTVYGPTLSGHGGEETDLVKTGWKEWYQSSREGYLKLRGMVSQTYVGGLSMGATLALKLASEFPEIQAAGVFGITLKYDGWNIPPTRIFTPFLPILVQLPFFKDLAFEETFPFGIKNDRLRDRIVGKLSLDQDGVLMRTPWKSLNELFRFNRHMARKFSEVKCPTLILHAREDDICSFESNALYLQKALGSKAELHCLENSYHMVTIDSDRDRLIDLTTRFFLKHERSC